MVNEDASPTPWCSGQMPSTSPSSQAPRQPSGVYSYSPTAVSSASSFTLPFPSFCNARDQSMLGKHYSELYHQPSLTTSATLSIFLPLGQSLCRRSSKISGQVCLLPLLRIANQSLHSVQWLEHELLANSGCHPLIMR